MKGNLTAKQAAFVREYAIDKNATQSAIRAGYSARNADKIGSELLGKTRVAAAIDRAIAVQTERTLVSADRVIAEFAKIAFANAQSYHGADGNVQQITDLSNDDAAAIQSFERSEDGSTKIKLCDKLKSLDSLAKHLGLLQPDSGEATKSASLQIFLQSDDGTITNISDDPMSLSEQTAGIKIDVVDGRKYPEKPED